MTCFRYFGYKSIDEVDRVTIPEYNLMIKALRYKMVDEEYRIHKLAYMATVARGTKGEGKHQRPVYPTFKKFFDYEKELNALKVKKPDSRFKGIGKIIGKGDADNEQYNGTDSRRTR